MIYIKSSTTTSPLYTNVLAAMPTHDITKDITNPYIYAETGVDNLYTTES